MSATLLFVQILNGLQFGLILFLIAAGLTLVFGVMDFINLAHGVQYMLGAYLLAAFTAWSGSFGTGLLLAMPTALAFGLALEFAERYEGREKVALKRGRAGRWFLENDMAEEFEFVGDVGASELVPEVAEGQLRLASPVASDQQDADGEG